MNLTGSKIFLRTFTQEDITTQYIAWLNDPQIMKYSNQRFITHTNSSCLIYLTSFFNTSNKFLHLSRIDTGAPIGTMTAYVSEQHGVVDIGIMIGEKSVWGQGYGQDAWNTVLEWYISNKSFRKITAGTLACNHGMINLMERSGMELEAVRKKQELVDSNPVDLLYYSKFL